MQTLVTGANGLLGSNLVRLLSQRGHKVKAMVRPTSDLTNLKSLNVELVYGDVRDKKAVREAADNCELMFHTAAVFAYHGYSKEDMQTTATLGATCAVEAAKDAGVKRFILTSTAAVLGGNNEPIPLSENAELQNTDVPDYFTTKVLQEKITQKRAKELGLDLVIVNPTVFLGPNDFRQSVSLSTITGYVKDPFKLTYPGGANIIHVEDVALGHLLLSERAESFERYLLGSENLEWPAIHTLIAELYGIAKPRIQFNRTMAYLGAAGMELIAKLTRQSPMATRAMAKQVGRYFWVNTDKAKALGFSARPVRQTLQETIAWLKAHDLALKS